MLIPTTIAAWSTKTAASSIWPSPRSPSLRIDPKYASAYKRRGDCYDDKHDYDRAIADYDALIRLQPKCAQAYNNRGAAREHQGDLNRAVEDFTQAIRLDPKLTQAYSNRASVIALRALPSRPKPTKPKRPRRRRVAEIVRGQESAGGPMQYPIIWLLATALLPAAEKPGLRHTWKGWMRWNRRTGPGDRGVFPGR